MSIPNERFWTYEHLALLPEDGKRHEIVDGEHLVTPAPLVIHQAIVTRLSDAIRDAEPSGDRLPAPCDLVLSNRDVVQPDLLWVSEERSAIISPANLESAPDLVVEVLSPSSRRADEILKRDLYERHGVVEYWIVDPELETVKIYRLGDGRFGSATVLTRGQDEMLRTQLFPRLALPLADLFKPIGRR